MLRPIGTEYWQDFPPDLTSTDPHVSRIKYRVVEHVTAMRFTGDEVGELVERVEPLAVER